MTDIDIFSDEVRRDPYPMYNWLRAEHPVHWNARAQSFVVTRYADAVTLLAHPNVSHWSGAGQNGSSHALEGVLGRWLRLMDPRSGSALRSLVGAAFAPKVLEATRAALESTAERLLDAGVRQHRLDVVNEFAAPFTLVAAARLFGIPEHRHDEFSQLAQRMSVGLFGPDSCTEEAVHTAGFARFIGEVLHEKATSPGPDLVTAILRSRESGDDVDEEDFLPFLSFFLFASHENVMNFIGNSIRALMEWPDELSALRESPQLLRSGVEELLRYDSPVQFIMIELREDLDLSGIKISQGAPVLVCVGSANRDGSQFAEANRLDVRRQGNKHLSFGFGPLTCVGSALARLEGRIAVASISRSLPLRVLSDTLVWRRNPPVLRGLESFVLVCGGASDDECTRVRARL